MAKVTWQGFAKPDDPIYQTGPVIGGKRLSTSSKDTEENTEPEASEPEAKDPETSKPGTTLTPR